MTEGFNAADNSSIAPVILLIAPDHCQNSVVPPMAGEKRASCEGFFRLTVEDFRESAIDIIIHTIKIYYLSWYLKLFWAIA